jgi:hypothetical protein
MGMFDEVVGNVKCPKCNSENEFYEQFKWSDCLLDTYELGDWIRGANRGYDFIESYFGIECEQCKHRFNASAVLRNGLVIAFLNEKELKTMNLDDIPDPEEGFAKNERYRKECEKGIGRAREWDDFKNHPKNVRDSIIALGHKWMIKAVYKEWLSETDPAKRALKELCGGLGRNSTDRYLYKVYNKTFGTRWILVEDRMPLWRREQKGNITVYDKYETEDGYSREKIQ